MSNFIINYFNFSYLRFAMLKIEKNILKEKYIYPRPSSEVISSKNVPPGTAELGHF